jgi:hypothetical protein
MKQEDDGAATVIRQSDSNMRMRACTYRVLVLDVLEVERCDVSIGSVDLVRGTKISFMSTASSSKLGGDRPEVSSAKTDLEDKSSSAVDDK